MSNAIDTALIVKLQTTPGIQATAPGGVYWDVAPLERPFPDAPFIIVTLLAHEDNYQQAGGHYEVGRYMVKAVGKGENSIAVRNAADEVFTALQNQPITAAGYAPMMCHREERQRYVEVDGATRWQHNAQTFAVWEDRT